MTNLVILILLLLPPAFGLPSQASMPEAPIKSMECVPPPGLSQDTRRKLDSLLMQANDLDSAVKQLHRWEKPKVKYR